VLERHMINQVLNNRYRIVRVLGSGTSGLIYLAADNRHPDFSVCVIRQLKIPKKNSQALNRLEFLLARKPEALERLRQNNQSPEILDFFVEDKNFYLVEEFLPGHPLNPPAANGQLQAEDQGVLRLQEMLSLLEPEPEVLVEPPLRHVLSHEHSLDFESLEPQVATSSPGNLHTGLRRKYLRLALAGGVVLAIFIAAVLLLQSQNQTKAKEFYKQGVEKLTKGDRQGAIKDFDQSIQLNSQDPVVYGNRGNAHYAIGAKESAIGDYNRMVQLAPNNPSGYYNRGLAYYDMKELKRAV